MIGNRNTSSQSNIDIMGIFSLVYGTNMDFIMRQGKIKMRGLFAGKMTIIIFNNSSNVK